MALQTVKVVLEGLDAMSVVGYIGKTNKKYQAALLAKIEATLGSNTPEFKEIRKYILDYTNDFARDVVKDIFGEVDT